MGRVANLVSAVALIDGKLPWGGGPWWYRLAGVSQMGLIIVALAPFNWPKCSQFLTSTSVPIGIGQCSAILTHIATLLIQNQGQ